VYYIVDVKETLRNRERQSNSQEQTKSAWKGGGKGRIHRKVNVGKLRFGRRGNPFAGAARDQTSTDKGGCELKSIRTELPYMGGEKSGAAGRNVSDSHKRKAGVSKLHWKNCGKRPSSGYGKKVRKASLQKKSIKT